MITLRNREQLPPIVADEMDSLMAALQTIQSRGELFVEPRLVPPGSVVAYCGENAPTGWLMCNGANVSREEYATLYSVLGTTYGVGDGSTTFGLPDLRQRFPLGRAASGTGSTLGARGGAIDPLAGLSTGSAGSHSHNVDSHTHGLNSHTHSGTTSSVGDHQHSLAQGSPYGAGSQQGPVGTLTQTGGGHDHSFTTGGPSTGSTTSASPGTDSGGAHTHTLSGVAESGNPPYIVLNFIIKA